MDHVTAFIKDNWTAMAGVLYFLALLASHLDPNSLPGKVAKWLLTGGVLKKPDAQ